MSGAVANIGSMPRFGFTVTEHDAQRPWIVLGQDHCTVTLEDGEMFYEWAAEQFPPPRWSVQLDPFQLSPDRAP
jgi:hypothetical protein